ncbi:MAG: glycosyltransferase family 2 protein [Candidatus Bipolaricaulia bacterium]
MKLSVAIPAHNEEQYIVHCLDSLARQEFAGELEIVVCLNLCTDKTEEIVRGFAQRSPWPVKIVFEGRKGVGWARQTACLATSGEIIASADADAIYHSDWAARIARAFSEDPKLVVLYGPVRLRGFGAFWGFFHPILNDAITHGGRLFGWHNVIGSNFAMRREAFFAVGGFNTSLKALEDHEIVRRLRRLGRVRYDAHLVAYASARRYNRLGVWKTISFYVRNAVRALVLKRETEDLEDLTPSPQAPLPLEGERSRGEGMSRKG